MSPTFLFFIDGASTELESIPAEEDGDVKVPNTLQAGGKVDTDLLEKQVREVKSFSLKRPRQEELLTEPTQVGQVAVPIPSKTKPAPGTPESETVDNTPPRPTCATLHPLTDVLLTV